MIPAEVIQLAGSGLFALAGFFLGWRAYPALRAAVAAILDSLRR